MEDLLRDLPARLQQRTLRTLGILVDADRDPLRQWQRLRGALASTTVILPPAPVIDGWVVDTTGPVGQLRLGIWIMPSNDLPGILEDFVITLIPENDALLPHANDALTVIESENAHRYTIAHRSKALIHTWLAWQETPGNPMGTVIGTGHLRADALPALAFMDWLCRLFDPSPSSLVV